MIVSFDIPALLERCLSRFRLDTVEMAGYLRVATSELTVQRLRIYVDPEGAQTANKCCQSDGMVRIMGAGEVGGEKGR